MAGFSLTPHFSSHTCSGRKPAVSKQQRKLKVLTTVVNHQLNFFIHHWIPDRGALLPLHRLLNLSTTLMCTYGCPVIIFNKRTGHGDAECVEGRGMGRRYFPPQQTRRSGEHHSSHRESKAEPQLKTKTIFVHFLSKKPFLVIRILLNVARWCH